MIKDMKQQFSGLLREIGFLDSSDPKAAGANHNSGVFTHLTSFLNVSLSFTFFLLCAMIVVSFLENLKLVKAILCAGLYPNVASINHHPSFKRQVTHKEE